MSTVFVGSIGYWGGGEAAAVSEARMRQTEDALECVHWGGDDEMASITVNSISFVRIDGIIYTGNTVEAPLQYKHPYNHPYRHPYRHHHITPKSPSSLHSLPSTTHYTTAHDPPPPF